MKVLTRWYQYDGNARNGQYKLLPISTHYPGFLDRSNEVEFKAAEIGWWGTFDDIQFSFRRAVSIIPDDVVNFEINPYFDSVTDDETRHGFSDVPNPGECMVWFKRDLQNIDTNIDDVKAGIFTDKLDGKVNTEARERLIVLLDARYSLGWRFDQLV
jgi:hypothetical protein